MDLLPMAYVDLLPMAYEAMTEAGFITRPNQEVQRESQTSANAGSGSLTDDSIRDLRGLLWSSIDNPESRDLDQVEVAQREDDGSIRLLVGIADVDAFVPKDSATDRSAYHNTTSVYTGVHTFPMLPVQLSEDRTSLLQGEDHLAVVVDLTVDVTGAIIARSVYRALVHNHAKLTYEAVGTWLEDTSVGLPGSDLLPGLSEQIQLQNEAAQHLLGLRRKSGALDFETIEATPVVVDGKVMDLRVAPKNQARYLIENFMVAVNNTVAEYLQQQGAISIQRVVRTPERWNRIAAIAQSLGATLPAEADSRALAAFLADRRAADPVHFPDLSLSIVKLLGAGEYTVVHKGAVEEGHFGLAVEGYTHSTAPNRRYADLVTQRLLKAVQDSAPAPYTEEELVAIAARCTERANAARKVERRMRKAAAAVLLRQRIGETFDALVTGASGKGVFVRLLAPPAEGRIMRGIQGLDVGDAVHVRLLSADPVTGFIDFETVP
ncbi:MAG: RNB domain-containing ribonuclease [Armatimonadota bacterium]